MFDIHGVLEVKWKWYQHQLVKNFTVVADIELVVARIAVCITHTVCQKDD